MLARIEALNKSVLILGSTAMLYGKSRRLVAGSGRCSMK
jgi:hypothetical protein